MRPSFLVPLSVFVLGNSSAMVGQANATRSEPTKTSYQLIDEALAAKTISEETAHKYRVFAGFGDSRLPQQYRGRDAGTELPDEVRKVSNLLKTFSPQTQADLAPFFMRPEEPGSWITLSTLADEPASPPGASLGNGINSLFRIARLATPLRVASSMRLAPAASGERVRSTIPTQPPISWKTFTAVNGKAKVWAQDRYPGDAAKAESLAHELSRHIWKSLTTLMKQEPASDATVARNGGDGAFDFYLVHAPMVPDKETGKLKKKFEGETAHVPEEPACGPRRYILLDSRQPIGSETSPGMLSTAAHELMHAIVLAYPPMENEGCGDHWIMEASATWAEHFVYPRANAEHVWLDSYLAHPRRSIDYSDWSHEYGAYLLPYFAQIAGLGTFMPSIWEKMKTKPSFEAINDVLPKGWDEQWPLFLLANWNQVPADRPGYQDDAIRKTAFGKGLVMYTSDHPQQERLKLDVVPEDGPEGLPYLSGAHFKFTYDNAVRSIVFENTIAELAQAHISVWGYQKIKGAWVKPENWTREFSKAWCRDEPKQDLDELLIIIGNNDWQTKKPLQPTPPPLMTAYRTGCTAWGGTIVTTTTAEDPSQGLTITEVVRANMRFVVDTTKDTPGQPHEYWKVESGTLSWKDQVTGACSGEMNGSRAIKDRGPGIEEALFRIWNDGGKMVVSGMEGQWPSEIPLPIYTIKCPNKPEATFTLLAGGVGIAPKLALRVELSPDGKSFSGDEVWEMTPQIKKQIKYEFHVSP
jgi:hypothetical protein